MGETSQDKVIKAIKYYQDSLERHSKTKKSDKLLHAIERLSSLPIRVCHLEETGVGRTVNGLKRYEGEVGESARNLVDKWKSMVKDEEDEEQSRLKQQQQTKQAEEPLHDSEEEEVEDSESLQIADDCEHLEKLPSIETKESSSSKSKSSSRRRSSDVTSDEGRAPKKSKTSDHEHSSRKRRRKTESDNSDDDDSDSSTGTPSPQKRRTAKARDVSEDNSSSADNNDKSSGDESSRSDSSESDSRHRKVKHSSKSSKDSSKNKRSRHDRSRDSKKAESHKKKEKSSKSEERKHRSHKSESSSRHKGTSRDMSDKEVHTSSSKSSTKEKHKHSNDKEKSRDSRRNEESDSNSKKDEKRSSKKHEERSKEKDKKKSDSPKKQSSSKSSKEKSKSSGQLLNGIDSGSGASFADVLGMLEAPVQPPKAKKKSASSVESKPSTSRSMDSPKEESRNYAKTEPEVCNLLKSSEDLEPLNINISSLLPSITPNYRPLGLPLDGPKKAFTDEEALNRVISAKHQRTKVYSGNKSGYTKVSSLFDICSRVLQDNLDALEYTGGVPYSILKPILEKANPDQLYQLEFHNPYLIEDTDELWQLHCQKEFRNKKREEMESWRDMYLRCLDEREAKLKALTANIKQSQDKSTPVRQTKLAYVDSRYVKPPRNIARKQAKNGTAMDIKRPSQTPTERLGQLAKAGEASKVSVPNPGRAAAERSSSSTSLLSSHVKPKKAPLMAKTLSLLKNRFGRR